MPQIKEAKMKQWAVMAGMMRGFGFALMVFGIFPIMAAGSAHAWPRAGVVGHFPHRPAMNRRPVAEKPYSSVPVETANLPVDSQSRSHGDKNMEDGKKLGRQYVDVGP
jgi:hypothetical protein